MPDKTPNTPAQSADDIPNPPILSLQDSGAQAAPSTPVATPSPMQQVQAPGIAPALSGADVSNLRPTGAPAAPETQGVRDLSRPQPAVPPAAVQRPLTHSVAHMAFQALAGGRDIVGYDNSGNPQYGPELTTKGIMARIAAAALAGAFAGVRRDPGEKYPSVVSAFGKGGAAGMQLSEEQRQQAAQNYNRKLQTTELNMRNLLTASEINHYEAEDIDKAVELQTPVLAQLQAEHPEEIVRGLTDDEIKAGIQSGKYSIADNTSIIDGRRLVTDAKGNRRWEATHAVLLNPNAQVKVTPETYHQWAQAGLVPVKEDPAEMTLHGLTAGTVLRMNNSATAHNVLMPARLRELKEEAGDSLSTTQKDENGKAKPLSDLIPDINAIDWKQPGVQMAMQRYQRWHSYHGQHGMDVYEELQAMGQPTQVNPYTGKEAPNPDAPFANDAAAAFGGWDVLRDIHNARVNREAAAAAAAKTIEQHDPTLFLEPSKDAQIIRSAPSKYSKDVVARANKIYQDDLEKIRAGAQQGALGRQSVAVQTTNAKDASGQWNTNSVPVSLVEGTMDPSQLTKRSANYNSVIEAANEYSQEKYGRPFDMAKAQSDYKFSTDRGTQNTLKYVNSLTGDPRTGTQGNLDLLVRYSNLINRTDFPSLNDAAAWARLETGDPNIVKFHNAAVDAADQFAKIMSGGGSGNATSDAKIKQGMEMFRTGFTTKQVIASASSVRNMLNNRKRELIGDNRYLLRQYGSATPSAGSIPKTVPATKIVKPGLDF